MSIAYDKSVSPVDMQDGRRRAWRTGPHTFEVIARGAEKRYQVAVVGGLPLCNCTAAHYGQPCWHASLVLARLEREAKPEPMDDDPQGRIAARAAELTAKQRLSNAEREELAILTYQGPVARRVAFSDEVPF